MEIEISAQLAVSGDVLGKVRVHPEASVRSLRDALYAAFGKEGTYRLLGSDGDVLPEGAQLEAAGLRDGSTVLVVRCQASRVVMTASNDNTARLWDQDSGNSVGLVGHYGQVYAAVQSPDGHFLVTASEDRTARIWEAESGECCLRLEGHFGEVYSAVFSPDGAEVLTASEDCTCKLWCVETGQCTRTLSGHDNEIYLALFSPDGVKVLAATGRLSWCSRLLAIVLRPCGVATLGSGWLCCAGTPTSSLVRSSPLTARLWSRPPRTPLQRFGIPLKVPACFSSGTCQHTLSGHAGPVKFAAFAPRGEVVVTTSEDSTACLWDAASGELLRRLEGHCDIIYMAAFSQDGEVMVTTSEDHEAWLWNVSNGQLLATLAGHEEAVCWAEISDDGRQVVTASWDGTARVWCAETGTCLEVFEGHAAPVVYAAFGH